MAAAWRPFPTVQALWSFPTALDLLVMRISATSNSEMSSPSIFDSCFFLHNLQCFRSLQYVGIQLWPLPQESGHCHAVLVGLQNLTGHTFRDTQPSAKLVCKAKKRWEVSKRIRPKSDSLKIGRIWKEQYLQEYHTPPRILGDPC